MHLPNNKFVLMLIGALIAVFVIPKALNLLNAHKAQKAA